MCCWPGVAVDVSEEVAHQIELERYHRELEEANDQLRKLAVTDELTGSEEPQVV